MNLYLDTEFNGHGGSLISLALVSDTGLDWYAVWELPTVSTIDPWVKKNVLPKLDLNAPIKGTDRELREDLHRFLKRNNDGDIHIYADWPADFEHFLRLLRGPTFDTALYIPMTLHMLVTPDGEPKPIVPHNAFADAMALMQWHRFLISKG